MTDWLQEAQERGYRDALFDVYQYLTANPAVLDIDGDRLSRVENMVAQVNTKNGRLVPVE